MSQPQPKNKCKPLAIALSSLFFTASLLAPGLSAYAADTAPSNVPASATSQPAADAKTVVTDQNATHEAGTASTITTTKANTQPANQPVSHPSAALDKPNMPDSALISWVSDAARTAYSYDFKNYANQIQRNQQNFTGPGWTAFTAALSKSNNLKIVQDKKLVASAVLNGKPKVIRKGVKNGVYFWQLQIPLLATYENESRIIKQNLIVDVVVNRTDSPNGVGISHFVATVVPGTQPITTPPTTTTTTGVPPAPHAAAPGTIPGAAPAAAPGAAPATAPGAAPATAPAGAPNTNLMTTQPTSNVNTIPAPAVKPPMAGPSVVGPSATPSAPGANPSAGSSLPPAPETTTINPPGAGGSGAISTPATGNTMPPPAGSPGNVGGPTGQ
jgi:hypothetical protein